MFNLNKADLTLSLEVLDHAYFCIETALKFHGRNDLLSQVGNKTIQTKPVVRSVIFFLIFPKKITRYLLDFKNNSPLIVVKIFFNRIVLGYLLKKNLTFNI